MALVREAGDMGADEAKAVVRAVIDAWNRLDRSAIEGLVAPALQAEVVQHFAEIAEAFSVFNVAIEELIAEGDIVAARLTVTGIHDRAPFAGVAPSGRRLTWGSFRFYRVRDGQMVRTWAMQDRLGLFQQLGLIPPLEDLVHWANGEPAR